MSQPTVVFVPGLRDHVADHWQTLLQERLPGSLCVPRLGKTVISCDAWIGAIDQTLIERTPGLSYAYPVRLNAKLAALAAVVGSADAAPTRQSQEVFAELSSQLDRQQARLRELLETDLASIEAALRAAGVPLIAAD